MLLVHPRKRIRLTEDLDIYERKLYLTTAQELSLDGDRYICVGGCDLYHLILFLILDR